MPRRLGSDELVESSVLLLLDLRRLCSTSGAALWLLWLALGCTEASWAATATGGIAMAAVLCRRR